VKALLLAAALAACGGGQKPPPPDEGDDDLSALTPPDAAPMTELQRRQVAACDQVIPRLVDCTVELGLRDQPPEKIAEADIEHTAPIHKREELKKCKAAQLSSRQIRVLEVCDREESECEPLIACLDNMKPQGQGAQP
jgi:hypothetical protein